MKKRNRRNRKNKRRRSNSHTNQLNMQVESLEARQMLTTALDWGQEVAYIVNQARHDPQAYATSIGRSGMLDAVDATQPLALNETLYDSAQWKSNDMVANNYFGHTDSQGRSPSQLIAAFGYSMDTGPGGAYNGPESIAAGYSSPADTVEALIVDQGVPSLGHRKHLLSWGTPSNSYHNEIGVGYNAGRAGNTFSHYTTIHAFRSDHQAQYLTGVVYNDADGDNRYDAGEGFASSVVVNGQTIQTNAAGGWSVEVEDGEHFVQSQGTSVTVFVAGSNRQVDFEQGTAGGWVDFSKVGETTPDPDPDPDPGPPTDISLTRTSINENWSGGLVGVISVADPTPNDTHTFALSDDRFEVTGNQLRLKSGTSLNHEVTSSISLGITATDESGQPFQKNFVIDVLDVNERPTNISLSASSVSANESGATVGTIAVADPDAGESHTFAVSDNRFEVAGNQLKLKSGQSIDRSASTIPLVVTATDQGGLSREATFSISVDQELDTTWELSARTVTGNVAGAIVGDIRMINQTGYSRSDFDFDISDDRFEVDDSLRLRLKAGVSLDPSTTTTVSLTVIPITCSGEACGGIGTPRTIFVMPGAGQADKVGSVLRISGTNGDDVYSVFRVGDELRFSNGSTTRAFTGVSRIVVDGMAGDDRISLGSSVNVSAIVSGRSGNDILIGTTASDDIRGGTGNDLIIGLDGNDNLYGDLGDDDIQANAGADFLSGGDGKDRLVGGEGGDWIHGGFGNDVLFGMGGIDEGMGQAGNDLIYGGSGNDLLLGGIGDDVISGHAGNDELSGESGDDRIFGGEGHDLMHGGDGADELLGFTGNDRIFGGNDDDRIAAGMGEDAVFGEAGDDRVFAGEGNDSVYGQEGNDELFGGDGNDLVFGGAGNNRLYGNRGADRLIGSVGDDYLNGGDGNDVLSGGHGDDDLYGMEAADVLIAGQGADLASGGAGSDLIVNGRAANEHDAATLDSMMTMWLTDSDVTVRMSQFKRDFGVTADSDADLLRGNSGLDAFFASIQDDLDAMSGEHREIG